MDIRALEVFLHAAETLNFSRTAEQMHLSVSAVSRTIQRLEADLGQAVLSRDRRGMELTAAGRAFSSYARDALSRWQQIQREVSDERELAGEISLFGSVTASYRVLAPILGSFRETHPRVDLMLQTGDQAEGIQRVLAGENDLSVSGRPPVLPERLAFLALLESPLRIIVPASDCSVRRQVIGLSTTEPADWRAIPLVMPERGVTRGLLEDWLAARQLSPRIYAQVAGHEAIVSMVALGLGVGIAPQLVIEASGMREQVDFLPLDAPLPPLSVGLCCLRNRLESPLLAAFWAAARQAYATGV
jgi:LysR family positive regulator for ilvC